MSQFEKITRPFATRDIAPGKPVVNAADQEAPENVVLTIGANGSGKTVNGSSNYSATKYVDKKPREKLGGQRLIHFSFPAITFP